MAAVAMGRGRFMTAVAMRCQTPWPTAGVAVRWNSAHWLTRGPSTASSAGSTTTAPTAAMTATAMPA